jgi:hypothetical protein
METIYKVYEKNPRQQYNNNNLDYCTLRHNLPLGYVLCYIQIS